jgi:hypothetical protein
MRKFRVLNSAEFREIPCFFVYEIPYIFFVCNNFFCKLGTVFSKL